MLFRSRRPGIGGQPFDCLKFRTMHTDAEQRQEELEGDERGERRAVQDPQRPAASRRIGGFLRRFSLDELPQLVNVLRGEMSLVGPRPLPLRDYDRLEDWHRKRYLVLPGITGLWQVSGRAELDFDELVRLDFLYLERWSVFLDLSILLKTLPAVLRQRARSSALELFRRDLGLGARRAAPRRGALGMGAGHGCAVGRAAAAGARPRLRRRAAQRPRWPQPAPR